MEISRQRYVDGSRGLQRFAEQITGLEVPTETIEKWRTLLSSMRIIDDRLDRIENVEERKRVYSHIKSFLQDGAADFSADPPLAAAMSDVRGLLETISDDKRAFFIRTVEMILKTTEDIKLEEKAGSFAKLTRLEGQLTSKLFLPFLPDEYTASDKHPQLVNFFARLGRVGNSIDSLFDLPADYQSGQTRVRPTLLNRAVLLGAVLTDAPSLVKNANISKELLSKFVRSVRDTMRDRPKK